MRSGTYNGHKNWAHWNVALWLANDEPLYRMARGFLASAINRDLAVQGLLHCLPEKTPDGARYNKTNVRAALRDL